MILEGSFMRAQKETQSQYFTFGNINDFKGSYFFHLTAQERYYTSRITQFLVAQLSATLAAAIVQQQYSEMA